MFLFLVLGFSFVVVVDVVVVSDWGGGGGELCSRML